MAGARRHISEDLGKLLLRVTLGALMLLHGIGKITGGIDFIVDAVAKAGLPGPLGYLVYVGEVIAPLCMIAGVWTRVAALIIAINMVVAIALAHMNDIFVVSRSGGWTIELQGFYLFTAVAVLLLGAGRISAGGANGRWN